jgi:alkaline phosphatase D
MKTIYYYQTFVGLDKLLTHIQDIDVIIVSSIHFDKLNGQPQIYLNDNLPNDKMFNELWMQTHEASVQNTIIMLMVGGAGGAYKELFSSFEDNYKLLKQLLEEKDWIGGIDLDIEESVKISDVKMLITRLINDFGENFIITMAPVASSLQHDGESMGGFNYKELYRSKEGTYIKWFNTQCYNSFSVNTFKSIIKNGYPPEKIVMGMESGQFDKNTFKTALNVVQQLNKTYPKMGGVYDWEYLNAPPNTTDPSLWAKIFKNNVSRIKKD